MSRFRRVSAGTAMMSLWLTVLCGCPGTIDPPEVVVDGNTDPLATSPLGKTFGEPNDDFHSPIIVVLDGDDRGGIQGSLPLRGDVDVYQLDALSVGDRIVVDMATSGSPLDVTVGLFDEQERLAIVNDDRTPNNLDSLIEFTVRHNSQRYFLVITASPFAENDRCQGDYRGAIRISRGGTVPAPRRQVLLLDFDGGRVESPELGDWNLGPLDAGRIHADYAEQTALIQQTIVDVVRENYAGFAIEVATSDEAPPADPAMVSIVYFGGFESGSFGLAEDVDLYNLNRCDDAIIFTESFNPDLVFQAFFPTAEEIGLAIGNVASHEAGHLLGLNHVADDVDLMDDVSPARSLIADQVFKESAISPQIMPIGTQDGVLLLHETLGGAP